MTFAGLYYHLSVLKHAGIIELAAYKEVKVAHQRRYGNEA